MVSSCSAWCVNSFSRPSSFSIASRQSNGGAGNVSTTGGAGDGGNVSMGCSVDYDGMESELLGGWTRP